MAKETLTTLFPQGFTYSFCANSLISIFYYPMDTLKYVIGFIIELEIFRYVILFVRIEMQRLSLVK